MMFPVGFNLYKNYDWHDGFGYGFGSDLALASPGISPLCFWSVLWYVVGGD
jgi:hypothetical protein